MRLWIKTLFKDLLALALLLSVFYFAGTRYLEIVSSKIRGAGDPIGTVSDLSYYPKRQISGDDYTYNLNNQDDLFDGDTISSDAFSSILMNLIDGTEISLENSSRIVLSLMDNTIYFDGTISALSTEERSEPLKLINLREENPQPIILGNASEITLSTDDKGIFNMSVLAGDVSRGEEKIEANEQFRLTPDGETSVDRMSFILSSPPNNSSWVTFEETQNMLFTWVEPQPAATRSLWIALDTDFEKIVFQADNLEEQEYNLDLLPGDYFWRVGTEEDSRFSTTGKIRIMENLPLKALLPLNETELTYRDQIPSPTFSWQGAENAEYWELELGVMSDMTNPVISQRTRYNQMKIDDLEEGIYWWHVTAQYTGIENIGRTSPTENRTLVVIRQDELKPPELISPEDKASLSPDDFSRGVRFSWKGDPEIPLYQFILSADSTLEEVLRRENTSRNYFDAAGGLEEGTYYWQIIPLTDGSVPVESSEIRSFQNREKVKTIELLSPEADEAITLSPEDISFIWDSSERENFRFRLWKITDGTERIIANSRLDHPQNTQYIGEEGDFLWQVDIMDEEDRVALGGTRRAFSVRKPLLPPDLTYPRPDSTIELIGEEKLTLSWNDIDNSIAYEGTLFKEGESVPLVTLPGTDILSYDIDVSLLSEGDYRMELRSLREDEGKGFPTASAVSRSSFSIGSIINYQAPVITSPSDQFLANRLEILQDGLLIRWDSSYRFPDYSLTLRQKDSGTLLMRRETKQNYYRIDDLYPDDYIIEVNGIDSRGRTSPAGRSELTIEPVTSLYEVRMVSPLQDETIDMSDLDALTFRWRQVEEGATYTLSLSDQSGNRIFFQDNYRGTEFVFRDLSKLDVGLFVFTVKAVIDYGNIGIVRTSPETRTGFSITLDTIEEAPVILSPVIQYAD